MKRQSGWSNMCLLDQNILYRAGGSGGTKGTVMIEAFQSSWLGLDKNCDSVVNKKITSYSFSKVIIVKKLL